MNIVYSDRAKQGGDGFALIEQATAQLKEVFAPIEDQIKLEWDRVEDERNRPAYTLTVSDSTEEAQVKLEPDELKKATYVRIRLYQLLGLLLQARNHRLMKQRYDAGPLEEWHGPVVNRADYRDRAGGRSARLSTRHVLHARKCVFRRPQELEKNHCDLERELALLKREVDELKKWKEDVKKRDEEWGRKLWMILPPVLAVLVSNAITLLITFYGKK